LVNPEPFPEITPVIVKEPVISESVFTLNLLSEIEAVYEPDPIWDKFNPVIPEAGILNKLAPDPERIPVFDTLNKVVPADSKVKASAPAETEAVTTPDFILSRVKSPAVVMGWPFNVAEPINCIVGESIIVLLPVTLNPALKLAEALFTAKPLANVPKPVLDTVNKLVPPLFKVKEVAPMLTEALIDPVAILDRFNPVIPVDGMPVNKAPEPENTVAEDVPSTVKFPSIPVEPVKKAGPIFLNVLDPETVNEPVMTTNPSTIKKGLTIVPELVCMVPGSPIGPAGPGGPEGPGAVTTTTLVLISVVTILFILLLL
jgi:hypothetical protein